MSAAERARSIAFTVTAAEARANADSVRAGQHYRQPPLMAAAPDRTPPAAPADRPLMVRWRDGVVLDTGLRHGSVRVAMLLATYANADGSSCHPSTGRLAEQLAMNPGNVRRALRELRDAGWLTWSSGGRGRANHYRFRCG